VITMIKKALLKLILTKQEYNFIQSSLRTAKEEYIRRYNDIHSDSYHSEPLKRNIPKLIEIIDKYFSS